MDYHSSLLYLSIIENIIKGSGKIYEKTGRVFIVLLLCFVGDTACSKSISDHTNQVIGEKNNSKAPGLVVLDNETIRLFKQGKIKGIPFPQDGSISFNQVTKKWGKPDKVIDNEDIKD